MRSIGAACILYEHGCIAGALVGDAKLVNECLATLSAHLDISASVRARRLTAYAMWAEGRPADALDLLEELHAQNPKNMVTNTL